MKTATTSYRAITGESITTIINREFLIRWEHSEDYGTNLISGGQYHTLVGLELAQKHFTKALNGGLDRMTFKLRRGLTINFLSK